MTRARTTQRCGRNALDAHRTTPRITLPRQPPPRQIDSGPQIVIGATLSVPTDCRARACWSELYATSTTSTPELRKYLERPAP